MRLQSHESHEDLSCRFLSQLQPLKLRQLAYAWSKLEYAAWKRGQLLLLPQTRQQQPRLGVNSVIFSPIVSMTRHLHINSPMTIPAPLTPESKWEPAFWQRVPPFPLDDGNNGCQSLDRIGHIISTMGESNETSAHNLKIR